MITTVFHTISRHRALACLGCIFALQTALSGCTGKSGIPVVGEIVDATQAKSPAQAAADAFNTYDADTRRSAIARLASASFGGEEPYLKTYRLLLTDEDPTVRAAAVQALGRHGTPQDVGALARVLRQDKQPLPRWTAAAALQKLHGPEAVPALIQAVKSNEDEPDVRRAAAKALGQYRQALVFDTLVGALNDRDFTVAQAAHDSLVTLTGQNQLPMDSRDWLTWSQSNRGQLFAGAQRYLYSPYSEPPGFFRRNLLFWQSDSPPEGQSPRGLDVASRDS